MLIFRILTEARSACEFLNVLMVCQIIYIHENDTTFDNVLARRICRKRNVVP